MSSENFNTGDDAAALDGAAGGENLQDALGETGETEFVSTESGSSKKPNALVILGLVLAVAGGGYLWHARGGPASADAASTEADKASQTVSKFLDGGTKNVAMMEKMLRDTEKVVQQFLNYPSMKQVPLADLHTNPFRMRNEKTEDGKPSESETAAKKRREEERQAVLKAVATLNLQSVIHSGTLKSCMINNTLYTEGQQVDDFVIERIDPGAVIVKNGVYRFELRMQK
jgi:hypothetical protein